MPLKVSDGKKAWIKHFMDSDRPNLVNQTDKKKTEMAIAAFYAAGGTDENDPDKKEKKEAVNEEVFGLQKAIGRFTKKANYDLAVKTMHDYFKKMGTKTMDIYQLAAKVASYHDGVDSKYLAKQYLLTYPNLL